MIHGIRNTRETIALSSNATTYAYIGDNIHYNNMNIGCHFTKGTLTTCDVTVMIRNNSDVDFWYKELYSMRISSDYDITKPWAPSATPTVGCHETRRVYAWSSTDVNADNGTTVIKPDAISAAGRWLDDSNAEYDKFTQLGTLTASFSASGMQLFEAIDFSGGTVLLKIVSAGTANASDILVIDTIVK